MQVFITGTDTNVGKTLVSSWLCAQTGYAYFKPIQTGFVQGCDRQVVADWSGVVTYPEVYCYREPVSPHAAASLEQARIALENIQLPRGVDDLIIEGAGGVLVPINETHLMIDVMASLQVPIILVASSRLGTINHTLLSLQALRARCLPVLGVIVSGAYDAIACEAITHYGRTPILACLPHLSDINRDVLRQLPLGAHLTALLRGETVCR